jgi:SAM-dependent methyltransferase
VKTQNERPNPITLPPGLRRYLYVTAAATGAAVMIVEILGAKMLAPYVGTSHFVWTAQIGVTLLALASGYAAGGWLVDRSPRPAWIYGGIIAAAAWLALATIGCERVAYACLRFRLAAGCLLAAGVLFFVPLALLAMVGPFFVRVLTQSVANVGSNVGRLTALSTMGSVAGTVLIGYVLIPLLPNSTTMSLTAGLLLTVATLYFALWDRKLRPPAWTAAALVLGLVGLAALQRPFAGATGYREVFRGNSNFGLLQVIENQSGSRRWYLNDLLTQNTYAPDSRQSFSLFTHMLHGLAQAYSADLRDVLCVGLGVGIVPMQFAREGAHVAVVEINPAVVPVAERFFGFERARVELHLGDGREFFNASRQRFDVIVLDAFLGESPPSHLMTRGAFSAMQRLLKPGGTLVINTFTDLAPDRDFFAASLDLTLKSVFRSVIIHDGQNGNVFYVASDLPALQTVREPNFDAAPRDIRLQAQAAFRNHARVDANHGRVLTDDYNPVDFYDARNRESLRRQLALSYRPE